MTDPILVIQTAFAGDLVLTLPLIDDVAERWPDAPIDVLCIPSTAALLAGHPRIRRRIVYDKRRRTPRLPRLMRQLAAERYGLCLCPHRSLRSALLAWATRAPRRIAFDRSAGRPLFTETVPYRSDWHEVGRNRSLLRETDRSQERPPRLFPSAEDTAAAEAVLAGAGAAAAGDARGEHARGIVCIAPGSVWATKRWTPEGFAFLTRHFQSTHQVVLLGGAEDRALCDRVLALAAGDAEDPSPHAPPVNVAGKLGFLASAALIGRAAVLISNDSAPVHLASAMGTPVVEIYGATSPAFGFSPYAVPHRIVQREDMECRPCAIHGGAACPIRTFACMRELEAPRVIAAAEELLRGD